MEQAQFVNNLLKTLCKNYGVDVNSISIPASYLQGNYTRQELLPRVLNLVLAA